MRGRGHGIEGTLITLALPKHAADLAAMATDAALTMAHEIAHTLGLRHGDMDEELRYCRGPAPAWADGLTISIRQVTCRPSDDRLAHARIMLARAETRLRRARTIQAKWVRRVARAERVRGAA